MSHLLEEYQNSLGVTASKPVINKHYFPIVHDNYILIYNCGPKNSNYYHHYDLVVSLLKSHKEKTKSKIIFIGDKEGLPTFADASFSNLSFRQYCYLISKASVFVSNNNSLSQYASSIGVPIVNLFADNYPKVCKGFWSKPNRDCINLKADWANKPDLINEDPDRPINTIPVEKVVNSIISLRTNFKDKKVNFKTKVTNKEANLKLDLIAPFKHHEILDSSKHVNIRLDLSTKENSFSGLLEILKSKKCCLYSKNSLIDYSVIHNHSQNIEKIFIIVDKEFSGIPESYLESINRLGVEIEFIVESECLLEKVRFDYFDYNVSLKDQPKKKPDNITDNDSFVSCRFVVSNGKLYNSMSHWKKGLDNNSDIIDNDDYWEELDYFYIYEQDDN